MKKQVDSLILLRGIAALAVVFCHFSEPLRKDNYFSDLFTFFMNYGMYGVQMFFVISGFVIPLSLDKSNYTLPNYFGFLKKRAFRLHIPYLAALFITLVVSYLSCVSRGIIYQENALTILQSIFYLHIPGENPVFWTLGIEVIYYIFIGLTFPVFKKFPLVAIIVLTPLLIFASQTQIIDYVRFFDFTSYFLIGIFGYFVYSKQNLIINSIGLAISIAVSFYLYNLPAAFFALFTIVFIFFYNYKVPKFFYFLGEISYSVYLLHHVLGVKFINLTMRFVPSEYYWAIFIIDLLIVYSISYVFYLFVEIPSSKLSNKVKYKKLESDTV